MLIFTRLKNQSFMVGDDVEVKILETQEGVVRLGITAPREIEVHRKEVYEAIKRDGYRKPSKGKDK